METGTGAAARQLLRGGRREGKRAKGLVCVAQTRPRSGDVAMFSGGVVHWYLFMKRCQVVVGIHKQGESILSPPYSCSEIDLAAMSANLFVAVAATSVAGVAIGALIVIVLRPADPPPPPPPQRGPPEGSQQQAPPQWRQPASRTQGMPMQAMSRPMNTMGGPGPQQHAAPAAFAPYGAPQPVAGTPLPAAQQRETEQIQRLRGQFEAEFENTVPSMEDLVRVREENETADLNVSPSDVLDMLSAGNVRFWTGQSSRPELNAMQRRAEIWQSYPKVAIIGCSDSRVPIEIVFDVALGDVFSIRVAGARFRMPQRCRLWPCRLWPCRSTAPALHARTNLRKEGELPSRTCRDTPPLTLVFPPRRVPFSCTVPPLRYSFPRRPCDEHLHNLLLPSHRQCVRHGSGWVHPVRGDAPARQGKPQTGPLPPPLRGIVALRAMHPGTSPPAAGPPSPHGHGILPPPRIPVARAPF
jgi:hypothetical protein